MSNFLAYAEEYIARHEPDKTLEQIMVEMETILRIHKKFNRYLRKNKITFDMPKKSDQVLERRKLFINWYLENNNTKMQKDLVAELELLVFASQTTIYQTIYGYRQITTMEKQEK